MTFLNPNKLSSREQKIVSQAKAIKDRQTEAARKAIERERRSKSNQIKTLASVGLGLCIGSCVSPEKNNNLQTKKTEVERLATQNYSQAETIQKPSKSNHLEPTKTLHRGSMPVLKTQFKSSIPNIVN